MHETKTESVAKIIESNTDKPITRLLVVGCGSGIEAAILARALDTKVVGIDVMDEFDDESMNNATLQVGDAMDMDFDDNSFNFVYSYHALEHIPDPTLALHEISRVLSPDGGFWIGTPNRLRAIGYLGSKDATTREKISWNIADWKARISGRFENKLGAHAGFSRTELCNMLRAEFSIVNEMSDLYFSTVYSGNRHILNMLRSFRLTNIAYPSVYFMGRK